LGADCPLDRSVRLGNRVLLERLEDGNVQRNAFNLASDPTESNPLQAPFRDLEERLETHFMDQEKLRAEYIREAAHTTGSPINETTREQLRALGYLDGDEPR
jgi:hypothetical protein